MALRAHLPTDYDFAALKTAAFQRVSLRDDQRPGPPHDVTLEALPETGSYDSPRDVDAAARVGETDPSVSVVASELGVLKVKSSHEPKNTCSTELNESQRWQLVKSRRDRKRSTKALLSAITCSTATTRTIPVVPPALASDHVNVHSASGASRQDPTSPKWVAAEATEMTKLVDDTKTMHPVFWQARPAHKTVTYYNPQYKIKSNGLYRVRGTAGGDRIKYVGDTKANVADIQTVKILLNSAISTPGGHWMTADITDFYLGTPMAEAEYMMVRRDQVPPEFQSRWTDPRYWKDDKILMKVVKTIYGLPQSGLLSQQRLVKHLAMHGYHRTPSNECLFSNVDRTVQFTLVVDDFGIKYTDVAQRDHLLSVLRMQYDITTDMTGSKYLGISIVFNAASGTVALSMPGYVQSALSKLGHTSKAHLTHSAIVFKPMNYAKALLVPDEDTSRLLTPAEVKRLQTILGIFLYYARIIDCTILPAVSILSTKQANPTEIDMQAADVILDYAASYPDAKLIFQRSDMILYQHSDATYLSEPMSKSRIAGYHYVGNRPDNPQQLINGNIDVLCKNTKNIVSSACEAEYVGIFENAKSAIVERNTLIDLGHPQPPTIITTDNRCAQGISNKSCKQSKSKSIHMRYHWIQDQVLEKTIVVVWDKGSTNLADFFTKIQPVKRVKEMRDTYIYTPNKRNAFSKGVLSSSPTSMEMLPMTHIDSPLTFG